MDALRVHHGGNVTSMHIMTIIYRNMSSLGRIKHLSIRSSSSDPPALSASGMVTLMLLPRCSLRLIPPMTRVSAYLVIAATRGTTINSSLLTLKNVHGWRIRGIVRGTWNFGVRSGGDGEERRAA